MCSLLPVVAVPSVLSVTPHLPLWFPRTLCTVSTYVLYVLYVILCNSVSPGVLFTLCTLCVLYNFLCSSPLFYAVAQVLTGQP